MAKFLQIMTIVFGFLAIVFGVIGISNDLNNNPITWLTNIGGVFACACVACLAFYLIKSKKNK